MKHESMSRRDVLRSAAVVGIAGAAGVWTPEAAEARRSRRGANASAAGGGPALTAEEMAAVDQALGKKGNLVADQGVYTVPLPRNDLKMTIEGEPVPIPFG